MAYENLPNLNPKQLTITKYGINTDMCPFCFRIMSAFRIENRRLNTAYDDDSRNWFMSCYECYEEAYHYYREMWDEYYSGLI